MPLIEDTPSTPSPATTPTIQITPPKYRGVVVDTRYVPHSALLTHVEGSSWTINYYSQVVDDDNALSGQNLHRDAVYQQWRLIKGMELKVTTPLTTSQDTSTMAMSTTGSANVYPFLIPNVGDMFLADIADGREGVFRVSLSERRSIFKESCHFIEYHLIDYSTDERRADFNAKVVQTLNYMRDFLLHGQNPLVVEEDYAVIGKLQGAYFDLVDDYFRKFLSEEYKTLLIPGQPHPTYDPYLVKVMMSMFTPEDSHYVRQVRILNCDEDDNVEAECIWDALLRRNRRILKLAFRQTGLVYSYLFASNPMFNGIYHSGIQFVVYPKDPELSLDAETQFKKILAPEKLKPTASHIKRLADLIPENVLDGLTGEGIQSGVPTAPIIKNTGIDDFYVFSREFYERKDGQSRLELMVQDYLDEKALNNHVLLSFCNTYESWGLLEKFYYVPVVLILLRASIRMF